jgi:glycosyltransferase involved in cell wall biosynthesis
MRISVIIPAHNASKTIIATLRSVFSQSLLADEVIVVDDGSTDDLEKTLAPFGDRITAIKTPRCGAAAARNAGASIAGGEALFFSDADLELYPTLFSKLSQALEENPDTAFAYSSFIWLGKVFKARPFSATELKINNYISTMSLIRRSAFPGFDESLPRFQDWDLWLTLTERGAKGVAVPEVLFRVLEAGTMSRRGGLSRILATRRIRKKHNLPWRFSDLWLALKESFRSGKL